MPNDEGCKKFPETSRSSFHKCFIAVVLSQVTLDELVEKVKKQLFERNWMYESSFRQAGISYDVFNEEERDCSNEFSHLISHMKYVE